MHKLLQYGMWEVDNFWAICSDLLSLTERLIQRVATLAWPPRKAARLVFDTVYHNPGNGARGALSARQLLYETDDRYIDVRIEPLRQTDRACVVGQLTGRGKVDRIDKGIAIRLQQGNEPIAETTTNEFGEFQMEFHAAKHLNISIGADPERITLPIYEV